MINLNEDNLMITDTMLADFLLKNELNNLLLIDHSLKVYWNYFDNDSCDVKAICHIHCQWENSSYYKIISDIMWIVDLLTETTCVEVKIKHGVSYEIDSNTLCFDKQSPKILFLFNDDDSMRLNITSCAGISVQQWINEQYPCIEIRNFQEIKALMDKIK
jgi:hypothetical protein